MARGAASHAVVCFLIGQATCRSAQQAHEGWTFRFGKDAGPTLQQRASQWLPAASSGGMIFVGDLPEVHSTISDSDVASLTSDEGFILRSAKDAKGVISVAVASRSQLGLSLAVYELLQRLGAQFMHPAHPSRGSNVAVGDASALDLRMDGGWLKMRGSHVHTEHPNELVHVLNGMDASGGFEDANLWAEGLPEWLMYLEWLIAQKQNAVEWSLLEGKAWSSFALSTERQRRLGELVQAARGFGLKVGIDCPFTQTQEHGFRLLTTSSTSEEADFANIKKRLDFVLGAGFQYVESEMGTTEMSHETNVSRILTLMNRTSEYLQARGLEFSVETHISGSKQIPGYPDPRHPGQNLTFNYLPFYLDRNISSRPHTVQVYTLLDPASTYGNSNFSTLLDFMDLMVSHNHKVVWFPETSYWCSYDTSVPLFLPLYALARLADLLIIQQRFRAVGITGDPWHGHVVWESGWAWGYWLNNLVSTRAGWLGPPKAVEDLVASGTSPILAAKEWMRSILSDTQLKLPSSVVHWVAELAIAQHQLLVIDGGIAYLNGWDAWADFTAALLEHKIGPNLLTQPPRQVSLRALRSGNASSVTRYTTEVRPLLQNMSLQFQRFAQAFPTDVPQEPQATEQLLNGLREAVEVLALRAENVMASYELALGQCSRDSAKAFCAQWQNASQAAIMAAVPRVRAQEAQYSGSNGTRPRLYAYGWNVNPSAYGYGQYWTVSHLYYWHRDEGVALGDDDKYGGLCWANIRDEANLFFGAGVSSLENKELKALFNSLLSKVPYLRDVSDCLVQVKPPPFVGKTFSELPQLTERNDALYV